MNKKRLPILLVLLLTMGVFHRCNVNDDLIEPFVSTDDTQIKRVQVDSDENLAHALEDLFDSNPTARKSIAVRIRTRTNDQR